MDINYQICYLRNVFNNKNIIDNSSKNKMSNSQTESIRKVIANSISDCESVIDDDFTIKLEEGSVNIYDTE